MVSVHQYKADTFAEVLDPNNKRLKKALNEFQACGNKKNMKASEVIALEEEIKPHIYRLCLWALGGIDGEGDSKTQWANYLLVYDNNDEEAMIEPVEEYCKKLSRNNTRTFGTPFSWSYQGKRGESIQLSCPTKLNR